jgi:hypothetical protein
MPSSGMLRPVALVRTDVTEECNVTIMKVTRVGVLGTMLAVTSNRRKLRRNTTSVLAKNTRRNIPVNGILHSYRREIPQILHNINRLGPVAET